MFVINKIKYTNPITYKIKDLHNEKNQKKFLGAQIIESPTRRLQNQLGHKKGLQKGTSSRKMERI